MFKSLAIWVVAAAGVILCGSCDEGPVQNVSADTIVVVVDRRMPDSELVFVFYDDQLFVQEHPFPEQGAGSRWLFQQQSDNRMAIEHRLAQSSASTSKTYAPPGPLTVGFVIEQPFSQSPTSSQHDQLHQEILDIVAQIDIATGVSVEKVPDTVLRNDFLQQLLRQRDGEAGTGDGSL